MMSGSETIYFLMCAMLFVGGNDGGKVDIKTALPLNGMTRLGGLVWCLGGL